MVNKDGMAQLVSHADEIKKQVIVKVDSKYPDILKNHGMTLPQVLASVNVCIQKDLPKITSLNISKNILLPVKYFSLICKQIVKENTLTTF